MSNAFINYEPYRGYLECIFDEKINQLRNELFEVLILEIDLSNISNDSESPIRKLMEIFCYSNKLSLFLYYNEIC